MTAFQIISSAGCLFMGGINIGLWVGYRSRFTLAIGVILSFIGWFNAIGNAVGL